MAGYWCAPGRPLRVQRGGRGGCSSGLVGDDVDSGTAPYHLRDAVLKTRGGQIKLCVLPTASMCACGGARPGGHVLADMSIVLVACPACPLLLLLLLLVRIRHLSGSG